jgi:ankyrin repeat protein
VHHQNTSMLKALFNFKALDPNKIFANESALHFASGIGSRPCVEIQLENGADINIQDESGRTPLHISIEKSHYELTRYLILKGADKRYRSS